MRIIDCLKLLAVVAFGSCAVVAGAAEPEAEKEDAGPVSVEFTLAAVSDYRFRGVSLSDKDPAFQPEVTVSHESGLYATLWGSNTADNGGDDVEIDITAGFAKEFGALSLDVGAVYYVYPGASSINYFELLGSVGTGIGKGNVALSVAYAPSQDNIGDQDNVYVAISGELPIGESPFTLNGSFGIEDGAFGDSKKDWTAGIDYDAGSGFTVGVKYIDTARSGLGRLARGTGVLSLSKSF